MRSLLARTRVVAFVGVMSLVAPGVVGAELCGDSDRNGSVTVTDGVNVLRQAAGLSSACGADASRCDVDRSGSISVTDGVNVLRHAAGLSATLSCPAGNDVTRFAGHYEGTFSGDDHGTFEVDFDCDGGIDGNAYSSSYDEDYDVSGETTREGGVTFTVGVVQGGATFQGTVAESGHVSGQWSNRFEDSRGSFSGNRTSQRTCS